MIQSAEEEPKDGSDQMNLKGALKHRGFSYPEFTSIETFLYSPKTVFHDPHEIISLCHFLCSGRKGILGFWFSYRPRDFKKRALSEESGNLHLSPNHSPSYPVHPHPGKGLCASDFSSLDFSYLSINKRSSVLYKSLPSLNPSPKTWHSQKSQLIKLN